MRKCIMVVRIHSFFCKLSYLWEFPTGVGNIRSAVWARCPAWQTQWRLQPRRIRRRSSWTPSSSHYLVVILVTTVFHSFSLFFQWIVGQNSSQNVPIIRPIILNRSQPPPTSPDPSCIEFWSPRIFKKQMQKTISKKNHVNHYKINFLAYLKVWDHSQIVDLILLIWVVSTRAPETHWAPHWWQNNVRKRRWPGIFSGNHGFG